MTIRHLETEDCPLCKGDGTIGVDVECPVCAGVGQWEFVKDENRASTQALLSGGDNGLKDRRVAGITASSLEAILLRLGQNVSDEAFRFVEIHKAGAARWGWAWPNANQFAIELAKMHGLKPSSHRYALTSLVWIWLEHEGSDFIQSS